MQASVTFETTTPESLEDGDHDDHGWIAPNEYRVSLGKAGHAYGKRVRMAQRGRYDWKLGDAVRFILGKLSNGQSEVDVDVRTGSGDRLPFIWSLRVTVEAVTCNKCHIALQRRERAPSFTHEELIAMWHALPAEASALKGVLRSAVEKLDAYSDACRSLTP